MLNPFRFSSLAIGLIVAACLPAQDTVWRIDPNHSAAYFSVRHLMISTVRGEFTGITGTVHYDPNNLAGTTLEATIDCSTLHTGVAKRDEQMKGPDFFEVKRYPTMKFSSRNIQTAGAGKLRITGNLTINATTHQVALDVDGPSAVVKDAQGREKMGSARLRRSTERILELFGMKSWKPAASRWPTRSPSRSTLN